MPEGFYFLANSPVTRLPPMMHNGNYFDFFAPVPVYETERKVRK